jgi:hypothetical protein
VPFGFGALTLLVILEDKHAVTHVAGWCLLRVTL